MAVAGHQYPFCAIAQVSRTVRQGRGAGGFDVHTSTAAYSRLFSDAHFAGFRVACVFTDTTRRGTDTRIRFALV